MRTLKCVAPLIFLAAAVLFFSHHIQHAFSYPFPPFTELVLDTAQEFKHQVSYEQPLASSGGFRDLSMVSLGARRLGADLAWLSVLQYYGGHESGETGHEDFGGGKYASLKKLVLRVMRLDPSLHYATLYGAGALAFNLNRPEEAIEILQEGIRRHPQYWKFQLYLGAILYKQKGKFDQMIYLLEDALHAQDCPTLVKSILANIYKERGNYARSLQIWMDIYEGKDNSYKEKASRQIEELRKRLGIGI